MLVFDWQYIMKHLAEQVRTRLISQLINGVSNVLNKLLKCINGTLILTFFVPLFLIPPAI